MTSLARRCPALCPGTARINVFWIGFVSLSYPPKYKCVAVSVSDGGYSVVPFRPLRVFDRALLQSYPQRRFNITHHGCALFGRLPPTNWNPVRGPLNSCPSALLKSTSVRRIKAGRESSYCYKVLRGDSRNPAVEGEIAIFHFPVGRFDYCTGF